jgi:hypothetical protein
VSPRVDGSRPYQRKNSLSAAIALLVTVLAPSLSPAQDTTIARGDSVRAVPADSAAAPRNAPADSPGVEGARVDSARVDSARVDSARVDSASVDTAARGAAARRAAAPQDSVLGAACGESGGAPPDLIVVKFRPTATAEERAAVAREVGGTVSGPSEHEAPGAWYLRVPGSAGDHSVADRLIQLPPVLEVGVARCSS